MVQITLFKHYAPGFRGEQDWGWRDRSGRLKRGRWMDGKEAGAGGRAQSGWENRQKCREGQK